MHIKKERWKGKQDTCTDQETQTHTLHMGKQDTCTDQETQTLIKNPRQTHTLDMLFRRMWKRLLRLIDGEAVVLRTLTSPPTTDPPPWPVRTSRLNTCGFSMYVHPLWTPTWTRENKPFLIIVTIINLQEKTFSVWWLVAFMATFKTTLGHPLRQGATLTN